MTTPSALLCIFFAAFTPPAIGVPDMNVTVVNGGDAMLPCTIDSNRNFTIVWMDKLDNVLYYNDERVIDDQRFQLAKMGNEWKLIIVGVTPADQGQYRCVANTKPIKLKYYQLTVFIPAQINRAMSSTDLEANEGTSVYLSCNATGFPKPTISWFVRKRVSPNISEIRRQLPDTSDTIVVPNITRYSDEVFTCTVANGYGTPDSMDIEIKVRFKPSVTTPNLKLSKDLGEDVELTCMITAYPMDITYWAKDNMEIMDSGADDNKYRYNTTDLSGGYVRRLSLHIQDINAQDYGYYRCVALNTLGREERYVELKAVQLPYRQEAITPEPLGYRTLPQSQSTVMKRTTKSSTKVIVEMQPHQNSPKPSSSESLASAGISIENHLLVETIAVIGFISSLL